MIYLTSAVSLRFIASTVGCVIVSGLSSRMENIRLMLARNDIVFQFNAYNIDYFFIPIIFSSKTHTLLLSAIRNNERCFIMTIFEKIEYNINLYKLCYIYYHIFN